MSNYLDTRDLDKRLDELRALRDAVAEAQLELREAESDPEHHTEGSDAAERFNQAENALDAASAEFGTDEQEELAELEDSKAKSPVSSIAPFARLTPQPNKHQFHMHRLLMPFRVAIWAFRNWENLAEVRHAMHREGFQEPQALVTFRWFYGRKFHGFPL